MKAVHIYGHTYGGEFVITQLRELRRMGWDVTVICPGDGSFAERAGSAGARVVFSDFQGSRLADAPKIIRSICFIRKYLRKVCPDVIHYHLIKAILVGRLACALGVRGKKISQLGGPLTLETPFFRWIDLITSPVDDEIICSSNRIKEIYGSYRWTKDKCNVVHYAFPLSYFLNVQRAATRDRIRSELGIQPETRVVGMVAYMYKSHLPRFRGIGIKGHEVLLEASVGILGFDSSVKFLVVGQDIDGGSTYLNELLELAEELGVRGSFIFTGFRQDIAELISAMDIVVVPSLSENCGGAVEPLLMGVPVVASKVGGLPDVVIEGVTGWLTPPGSAQSLSDSLMTAIGCEPGRLAEMGEIGRRLVVDLFDPEKNAKKIVDIYRRAS